MKNKIKDLFNTAKYKRRYNKMENNYKSVLEEIVPLKDEIIELQKDKITLLEKYNITNKELKELKKKEEKKHEKR
jgi:hypothetical protein